MKNLVDLFRMEQELQKYKMQGNIQQTLELYDQIIYLKQYLPNRLGLAKSIADKAFFLEQYGFRQEALQSYYSAGELMQNSHNRPFMHLIQERISNLQNNSTL